MITAVAFSNDGQELAIGTGTSTNSLETGGGKVYFYNAHTGKQLRSIFVYPKNPNTGDVFEVCSIVYSPTDNYIATGKRNIFDLKESNLTTVDVWDVNSGHHVANMLGKTIKRGELTLSIGAALPIVWHQSTFVLGQSSALYFWSMLNPKAPSKIEVIDPLLPIGFHTVYSIALGGNGLLAATLDNRIKVFQLPIK